MGWLVCWWVEWKIYPGENWFGCIFVSQILGICFFSRQNHHLDDLGKTEQSQQKYLQPAGFPNVSVMSPFVCPSYASREVNSNCGTLSRPQMIDISIVGKIRNIQHPTSNNKQPNQPSWPQPSGKIIMSLKTNSRGILRGKRCKNKALLACLLGCPRRLGKC